MGPFRVDAVLAGKAVPIRGDEPSAIGKTPVGGAVEITSTGLVGDEQADRVNHGGPEMAIHHYPRDHYAYWQTLKPDHPKLTKVGSFGENIAVSGWLETDVCIGDRFTLGSAVVEISQGRKPCWKQAHILEWPEMVSLIVDSRRSGWYYRVIEPGEVQAGDELARIANPYPKWTVHRVFSLLIGGEAKNDRAAVAELAELPLLSPDWRGKAEKLA